MICTTIRNVSIGYDGRQGAPQLPEGTNTMTDANGCSSTVTINGKTIVVRQSVDSVAAGQSVVGARFDSIG